MPAKQIKNLAKAVNEILEGTGSLNSLEVALMNLLNIYPNILKEEDKSDRQETDRDDPDIHGY